MREVVLNGRVNNRWSGVLWSGGEWSRSENERWNSQEGEWLEGMCNEVVCSIRIMWLTMVWGVKLSTIHWELVWRWWGCEVVWSGRVDDENVKRCGVEWNKAWSDKVNGKIMELLGSYYLNPFPNYNAVKPMCTAPGCIPSSLWRYLYQKNTKWQLSRQCLLALTTFVVRLCVYVATCPQMETDRNLQAEKVDMSGTESTERIGEKRIRYTKQVRVCVCA